MWGASFAELAKKAQEQASHLSTGEFFNLDAIQSTPEGQNKEKEKQKQDAATATGNQIPSFQIPSLSEGAITSPVQKPQAVPKGKLKIPAKKTQPDERKDPPEGPTQKVPTGEKSEVQQESTTSAAEFETEDAQSVQNKDKTSSQGKEYSEENGDQQHGNDSAIKEVVLKDSLPNEEQVPTLVENGSSTPVSDQNGNTAAVENELQSKEAAPIEPQVVSEGEVTEAAPSVHEFSPESLEENEGDEHYRESQNDVQESEGGTHVSMKGDQTCSDDNRLDSTSENAAAMTNLQPESDKEDQEGETNKSENIEIQSGPDEQSAMPHEAFHSLDLIPDSEDVKQQFTLQLQRLEENFQNERQELERQHAEALQQAVSSKKDELKQVRAELKEKDKKMREIHREKEGNELRMDNLQREMEGTKDLLQKRDAEIKRINEENLQNLRKMERKFLNEEREHEKTKKEMEALKDELLNSKGALGSTTDEFSNLKERVKVVAGELKERRAECRELKSKIDEMSQVNETLKEHIGNLESQLKDRDLSRTEQDEEVGSLRVTIEELKAKLKEMGEGVKAAEAEGEKALASYKKKAQNALAVANSRAAAAVQAKEEAELEARAARSTADTAMERARVAEATGEEAMVKAKAYYKQMEQEKIDAVAELEAAKSELDATQMKFEKSNEKLDLLINEKTSITEERRQISQDLESERSRTKTLERNLTETRARADALSDDVSELRTQLQKAEKALAAATKSGESKSTSIDEAEGVQANSRPNEDPSSKQTIILLQNQLSEANQTIEELKEALQNAVAMSEVSGNQGAGENRGDGDKSSNDSAPLFYAMEKQAELNTARNEINRLASLYADVQSEKNEAEEALEELGRELSEERAKLERYEKLGSVGTNDAVSESKGGKTGSGQAERDKDAGRTNIEYLKNIMLSFLNAKTLAEKKALVPVIGAVLCLTPDEQAAAIKNVEAAGGLEGVSSAFFESFGSKVMRK